MLGPFAISGATRPKAAAYDQLDEIAAALTNEPSDRAGVRLRGIAALDGLLAVTGPIGTRIAPFAGEGARPVRAILFDKSASTNWTLAWHQDRTICVRERRDVAGFGPWMVKSGSACNLIDRDPSPRASLGHASGLVVPLRPANYDELKAQRRSRQIRAGQSVHRR